MKLIEDKLYLEFSEMVECGVSENTLKSAQQRESNSWKFINDPKDQRKLLISYEDIKQAYKEKVLIRFGNPYDLVIRQPILDRVINNPLAYDFFLGFKYDGNKSLPIREVNKYTRMDAWLKMLGGLKLGDIKKGFSVTIPEFYKAVGELIEIEINRGKDPKYSGFNLLPGDFPTSYQRIKARVDKYHGQPFESLISSRLGNKNSTKIGKYEGGFDPELADKQMSVILATAAKHNNFDASQVEGIVNMIFEKNGWETIGRERILQIMKENKALLTPGRRGRRAYNSEIARQVKRTAPKCPTYYFTLDGWTAELLYQDKTGYDNRLVIVVVLDPFNKYPVGYAIGDRENAELIREANRNAILHLKELFGDYYRPHQLQSDNYAVKQLTPFYQAVAHLQMFTPAAVGNAKSKVIEPYFKYINKKYCQLMPNWSGFGITSRKENQVNAEFLNMVKKSFPDRQGAERQLESIIAHERKAKLNKYVEAWQAMPMEDKPVMNEMDMLMVFGVSQGATNKITGQGIVKTIDGVKVTYDSFDTEFRTNIHVNWQLFIDPQNRSKALAVSEDGKQRFLLEETLAIPMDIKSTLPEHHAYRKQITDYNKERVREITDRYAHNSRVASEVVNGTPLSIDSYQETALKLMFIDGKGQQKEGIQDAKGLKKVKAIEQRAKAKEEKEKEKTFNESRAAYMDSKMDFNQFID